MSVRVSVTSTTQIVTVGKAMLMHHPWVSLVKANSNLVLNAGSKDDELVTKRDWYAVRNQKATTFTSGKRAVLALFPDREAQLTPFLKLKKPDLKTRVGLASVVEFYSLQ